MTRTIRLGLFWFAGAILALGLHGLQLGLDHQRSAMPKVQQLMYVTGGEQLKIAVLGYRQFVADVLWLQAIQAMGTRKISRETGEWIAHVLDVITTLDPRFVRVYSVGGLALTTLVPLYEDSNRLLLKGI